MRRQTRSAGARSTEYLLMSEKRSMSGDRPRSQRSYRGDARSTKSQSRSSLLPANLPRDMPRERFQGDKVNNELHEQTKEALGNFIIRKEELESKGIETEIMYKELMNCVSPWRRKKLQKEADESQAALDDALKAADELMSQAKQAFDAYQTQQDPKRKEAAAGDLFWKSKVMHKTLTACIQVACNAESARDQLAWADKMGKIMNSMMAVFQILDDLKHQLSKERALTKTLTTMVQKGENAGTFDLRTLAGHGDEDLAQLLSRVGGEQRRGAGGDLFPSRWSFFRRGRLSLLLAAVLLTAAGSWAATAHGQSAPELLLRVLRLPAAALHASGLLRTSQPSWLETAQLWLVSLVYSLFCWIPGLCNTDPVGWSLTDTL